MRLPSARTSGPAAGWLLLVALLAGCDWTGASRVQPGDVRAASVQLEVALDRAADAHEAGEHHRALAAWRQAHLAWDETIGPGLERRLRAQEVVSLELHLARIRAALDTPGGDVRGAVKAFDEALDSPIQSLPSAPVVEAVEEE